MNPSKSQNQIRLHSFRRCPFAIRVRMLLEEKNIPYQLIEENLSEPSKELIALHPEGRVPLLIHFREQKDLIIFQSSIITEYLDEVFGPPFFIPQNPELKAEFRLWTYWCDYIFKTDLDLFKYDLPNLSQELKENLITRLQSHLSKWNDALINSPYLLGNELTLGDIHLFPFARQFMSIKPSFPDLEKYIHLGKWLDNILNRPAFYRVMNPNLN